MLMGRKIDGVLQRCSFLLPVIWSSNVYAFRCAAFRHFVFQRFAEMPNRR
jgi:hypothetical protein